MMAESVLIMNVITDKLREKYLLRIKTLVSSDINGEHFTMVRTKKNIDFMYEYGLSIEDVKNIILILIAILFSPMVIGVRFICCKIDKIENRKIKAVIKVIGFVVFSSYLVSLKENVAYLLIGIFSLVYLLYQFYLSGLETK